MHTRARARPRAPAYFYVRKVRKVRNKAATHGFQGSQPLPNLAQVGNLMTDLARLRRCFRVASIWCGWSPEERAEISAEIRAAIDAGDQERIAYWQQRMEQESGLDHMAQLCRAAEARIKSGKGTPCSK